MNNYDLYFDETNQFYNRAIRDTKPYLILKEEDENVATIILSCIGVDIEDINIKTEYNNSVGISFLIIKGETKNLITKTKFSFENRFIINANKTKEIRYNAKDGLLYIKVFFEDESIEIPILPNDEECSI